MRFYFLIKLSYWTYVVSVVLVILCKSRRIKREDKLQETQEKHYAAHEELTMIFFSLKLKEASSFFIKDCKTFKVKVILNTHWKH